MKTWGDLFKDGIPKVLTIYGEDWTLGSGDRYYDPGKQLFISLALWADGMPSAGKVWVVGW